MEKHMTAFQYAAIDPMALLLSDRAYLIWVEIHHPNEPPLSKMAEIVKSLTAEERKFAQARAMAMGAYAKTMEECLHARK
jgi:hypothetical protein